MAELRENGAIQTIQSGTANGAVATDARGAIEVAEPVSARRRSVRTWTGNKSKRSAAQRQPPQVLDQAESVLAVLDAALGPIRALLAQATTERRELQSRLDVLLERSSTIQLEANRARACLEAEQAQRVAAEARATDLGERLQVAQGRIDRLELEVAIHRKADSERRVAPEAVPHHRRWWPF